MALVPLVADRMVLVVAHRLPDRLSCNKIMVVHRHSSLLTILFYRQTSSLGLKAALVPLMAGRTTLVVAHRLSTVRHCDSIAVLEAGRILEAGPHAALMANPAGPYAQLVRHTQR